jgi:hypothetical protein
MRSLAAYYVGYVVGLLLALHGLARIVMQVELAAGITWLRWAQVGLGALLSIWCWGIFTERLLERRRQARRAR